MNYIPWLTQPWISGKATTGTPTGTNLNYTIMQVYKEIETSALLKMIPIEDAVAFYGDSEIIQQIGQDEILDTINEEDIANYLRKCGYKIEEPCEN